MDTQLPDALITTLSTLLGSEGWRLDAISRRQYSEDDSQCFSCADAVALPRDLNEVVAIVRACRQHRVPVIPRGTGLAPWVVQCRSMAASFCHWHV